MHTPRRHRMNSIFMRSVTLATIGTVAYLATPIFGPASAQDADADQKKPLLIDEITVTARKKAENILDVPLAINAFDAAGIERRGIENLEDVAGFTPGLTFSNLYGDFLSVPVIRGLAPTAIFRENNAAVFIDGVFVSGREGLNANQLDLERIEVIKGPQSTKYGRNAFAGAINYVSARPTEEFEGKADFTVGNYDKRAARLSLSGPLIGSTLLGRAAVQFNEWSGSYDNQLSRVDVGGYQLKNLQTSLWYTPLDSLDIKWFVYLADDQIDDSPLHSIAANCEDRQDLPDIEDPDNPGQIITNPDASDVPRPQNYCGTLPKLTDNVISITEGATGEERKLQRSSLHIDWETDFGSFSALTGYSNTEQDARTDGAHNPGTVPFGYLGTNGPAIFLAEQTQVVGLDQTTEISQELRFSSPADRAFRYEIGGYWYTVEADARETDVIARVTGENGARLPDDWDFLSGGFYPAPGVVGDAIFGPWFTQTEDEIDMSVFATNETDSWSVFGGIEFDIGDTWTFDASARYTEDDKSVVQRTGESAQRTWDYWTGRVGLRAQATENVMIYTSAANGKKSGGFDIIDVDLIAPSRADDPDFLCPNGSIPEGGAGGTARVCPGVVRIFEFDIEENTTFELGSKGTLWDGRAQYDIALFYTDWNDILLPQVFDVDPETGLPFDQPTGVDQTGGDATVYGVETNIQYVLTDYWSFNLGASWTDAEFDNGNLATYARFPSFWEDTNGDGFGDQGDINGKEVLRQSQWQGNFSIDYRRPVYQDWDFYNALDVLYQSSQWVGAANQAKIPDRTVANLRLGLDSERYQLEFWVENLFDDDEPVSAFRDVFFTNTHNDIAEPKFFGDLFPFRLTVRYPNRRTYGVTARVRF